MCALHASKSPKSTTQQSVLLTIFRNSFFIMELVDSCFRGRKEGIKKAANKDNLSYMRKISVHFMFTKSQL